MSKMTRLKKGYKYIESLSKNPQKFYENGCSYNLLEEYFHGFPLETLRPLLHSEDYWIKRVSIWICSELGYKADIFLDDILPLAHDNDLYVRDYAIDVIVVCAEGKDLKYILWILDDLESDSRKIRVSAMGHIKPLLSFPEYTKKIYEYLKTKNEYSAHEKGFLFLSNIDVMSEDDVMAMLGSESAIYRKYAVIAAHKLYNKYPQVIANCVNDKDGDIREYAKLVVKTNEIYNSLNL